MCVKNVLVKINVQIKIVSSAAMCYIVNVKKKSFLNSENYLKICYCWPDAKNKEQKRVSDIHGSGFEFKESPGH